MHSYVEPESFIKNIELYNHIILFYDSPESRDKIIYPYLADGLRNGKGIIYLRNLETQEEIREGFKSNRIDYEPNVSDGNILIKRNIDWYMEDGIAEPLRIMNKWHEAVDYFNSKGLGLRATGDVSCFFEQDRVRELLRYEYGLHKILTLPIDVICLYNLKTIVEKGYTEMIMPLVRAHGKALFTAEGGTMMLETDNVEDSDLEKLMDISI